MNSPLDQQGILLIYGDLKIHFIITNLYDRQASLF